MIIHATEVDSRYIETSWIGQETKYGKVVEVNFISNMTGSYTLITQDKNGNKTTHSAYAFFLELDTKFKND